MCQILVQNCQTKNFLGPANVWTPDPAGAADFPSPMRALSHCLENELADAQIVVKFHEPGACDVVVPVRSGCEPHLVL